MSGVVLRCPNCGTTQEHQGLCDACHEADVRWFCPNHTPGRWLDGPACAECGARVGVPGRAPASPRRPAPSAPPREMPRSTTPPSRAPTWDTPDEPPLEGPVRGPGAGREPEPEVIVSWPFGFPGRRRGPGARGPFGMGGPPDVGEPRAPGEPPWVPVDPAELAGHAARSAVGCIGRLVMIVIVLIVLAFLVLGGFLGGAFGAEPGASVPTCSTSAGSPAACGGSAASSP